MIYVIFFILISVSLSANTSRIEALLTIGDAQQALIELEPLLAQDPDNKGLQRLEVMSLAKRADITALLKAYSRYHDLAKCDFDTKLLEDVAWAIIKNASQSSSPFIRQEAYIASFMANDASGIPTCLKALNDPSEQLRLMATALAARAHDEALQIQTHHAIKHDASSRVRLESINAVGATRYEGAKETLLAILDAKECDAEEKRAAIAALSNITKDVDGNTIKTLVKSERASLRILACELVLGHYGETHATNLLPLMQDSVFDVRLAAIGCIAALGVKPDEASMKHILAHQDIKTKILANWLALVVGYNESQAINNLRTFLQLKDRTLRLFTSGAIAHSGHHVKHFSSFVTDDPLVRMNLAIGCIWQRHDIKNASHHLLVALKDPTRLSWQYVGVISFVGPSTTSHAGGISRLPESQDLLCRLELYSMLGTCNTVSIHEPLRAFLRDRTWGISGHCACLMMQEGLMCFDELRTLLNDPCCEISLQAAFILAFYAQDDEALKVLINAFKGESRQMKEYILFAVATIGTKSALPFLIQVLNEPFESLRVSAARGILTCLYK